MTSLIRFATHHLQMQANWQTATLNFTSYKEVFLPNITHAQR